MAVGQQKTFFVEGSMDTAKEAKIASFQVASNVWAEIVGKKLILTIDYTAAGSRSQKGAGPNMTIATTNGNILLPGTGCKLGLNLYKPVA
jgi:hypothetical protein